MARSLIEKKLWCELCIVIDILHCTHCLNIPVWPGGKEHKNKSKCVIHPRVGISRKIFLKFQLSPVPDIGTCFSKKYINKICYLINKRIFSIMNNLPALNLVLLKHQSISPTTGWKLRGTKLSPVIFLIS